MAKFVGKRAVIVSIVTGAIYHFLIYFGLLSAGTKIFLPITLIFQTVFDGNVKYFFIYTLNECLRWPRTPGLTWTFVFFIPIYLISCYFLGFIAFAELNITMHVIGLQKAEAKYHQSNLLGERYPVRYNEPNIEREQESEIEQATSLSSNEDDISLDDALDAAQEHAPKIEDDEYWTD